MNEIVTDIFTGAWFPKRTGTTSTATWFATPRAISASIRPSHRSDARSQKRIESRFRRRDFALAVVSGFTPGYARVRSRKNRIISLVASGPLGSVKDPRGSPPNHACAAPCTSQCSTTILSLSSLKVVRVKEYPPGVSPAQLSTAAADSLQPSSVFAAIVSVAICSPLLG
jgi:hypothetical protein